MKNYNGKIIKGIGGFYYVDTAEGVFECRARGVFRKEGITPLVGDLVEISVDDTAGTGAVDAIQPRQNVLLRPPVANVTQMAAVISTANPRPNLFLLDTVIAAAENEGIKILLCFNKTDIDRGEEYVAIYKAAGFDLISVSAETNYNLDALKEKLHGETTVFTGNSGVGKSSLLNRVFGKDFLETGEVSLRAERGKHTTRHSELIPLPEGGYIIDTPGFGSFDITLLDMDSCSHTFREFAPYIGGCRFRDCSHTVEKGCRVLEALENGEIEKSRHESYCRIMTELREGKKRR